MPCTAMSRTLSSLSAMATHYHHIGITEKFPFYFMHSTRGFLATSKSLFVSLFKFYNTNYTWVSLPTMKRSILAGEMKLGITTSN